MIKPNPPKKEICKRCNKEKDVKDMHDTEGLEDKPEYPKLCEDCMIELYW